MRTNAAGTQAFSLDHATARHITKMKNTHSTTRGAIQNPTVVLGRLAAWQPGNALISCSTGEAAYN